MKKFKRIRLYLHKDWRGIKFFIGYTLMLIELGFITISWWTK